MSVLSADIFNGRGEFYDRLVCFFKPCLQSVFSDIAYGKSKQQPEYIYPIRDIRKQCQFKHGINGIGDTECRQKYRDTAVVTAFFLILENGFQDILGSHNRKYYEQIQSYQSVADEYSKQSVVEVTVSESAYI